MYISRITEILKISYYINKIIKTKTQSYYWKFEGNVYTSYYATVKLQE